MLGRGFMNKIAIIAYRFNIVFKILLVAYPIFVTATWFGIIPFPKNLFSFSLLPIEVDLETLRPTLRFYAFFVQALPMTIVMISFYYLIKLFQLYSKKIVFSHENIILIRKIGLMVMLEVLIDVFLVQPILSLILTFDAPTGGHLIAISFGNHQLSSLITAGIIMLISWIMDEARRLEEESSLTV